VSAVQVQAKQATAGEPQVSAAAAPLTDLAGCVKPVRSRLRSLSFTCLHSSHAFSYAAVAPNKDSCCVTIHQGQHSSDTCSETSKQICTAEKNER
jgi:hypothetical protein